MAVTKSESFGCTMAFGTYTAGNVADADTTLGQINSIDGPAWSMDTVNVTTNDSTGLMEYLAAGIASGGECTVGVTLDPTAAAITAIVTATEAGTLEAIKITFTGDADYIWGWVRFTGVKIIPGPQDGTADALKAEVSMQITDDLTIVAGP